MMKPILLLTAVALLWKGDVPTPRVDALPALAHAAPAAVAADPLDALNPFDALDGLGAYDTYDAFDALDVAGELAPAPWAQGDPADSLYRAAREAMSKGDYRRAAELFHSVAERFPESAYAGDALYYEAFSLYRSGRTEDLRQALDALETLGDDYPKVAKRGDATTLNTRICGELARRGDEQCAASVVQGAGGGDTVGAAPPAARGAQGDACPSEDDESDERIAALNALLQMDADRAMPILQKVLARRDPCSAVLRRKAVFLVSQKQTPETADILLGTAKSDPDPEVREQAVFWLSQVSSERAVDMLDEIVRGGADEGIKEKALFALSQHRSERAGQILRDVAAREGTSGDLREKAIFWLGQKRSAENTEFLRALYGRLTNADLKEKVLFSLSQQRGAGNDKWLLDVALDTKQDIELRKKALFWAGQGGAPIDQLVDLYGRMSGQEMREQLIFVYSQRREPQAVDKLFDIARTEKDPELRKKAIFWLGQSRDPRVAQFLSELIGR